MGAGIATFGPSDNKNTGIVIGGAMQGNPAVPQPIATPTYDMTGSGGQVLDANTGNYSAAGGGSDGSALAIAQNNAFLDSQANDLNNLLGRTQTGLDQGLTKLGDSYTGNVNQQRSQEAQALQDYKDKRVATTKDRGSAYDTINNNANAGYHSLAQLIGRASGSGSSAFQEALPAAIGKEIGSKRADANTTYATNLGNIDTAQKKTETSFEQILQDLANQKASQEQALRTGVEQQRQTLQSQLGQNAAQRAQNNGGGYAQVAAAQAPYQSAIDNSRNSVESFFNQFKPTVTAQQAAIAAPDISGYQVDRSAVNAQAQNPGADNSNPYAQILRKQLQDQGAI